MRRKPTLKEVISVVKLSLLPIWCWPLSRDATRLKVLCVKLYHCLNIILALGLTLPSIYAIKNHINEPPVLVQLVIITSGTLHVSFNFVFYIINSHHIQNVTFEMTHFSNFMQLHEEIIIQRYINKCFRFYGASLYIFYVVSIITIVIPPVIHQPFPTFAEYPFDVYHQPLRTVIYIHQSLVGLIVSGQLCTNVFMALLLWFASARFEILIKELEVITNVYQLFKCIKKHQKLLKYAEEVASVARPFAFITICCSTVSMIVIFLMFMTHLPTIIMLQYFGLSLAGVSEVFMYTWPAEYLMYMSEEVAHTAFDIIENNHFIEIWKCLPIIIMRSQKPIRVTIPCLMPALSYHYFTSYVSTILSYFTTLRVMMSDDKN